MMSSSPPQAYNEAQARNEARRRELLKQYTDDGNRPFNARHYGPSDVEAELDHIERWQIEHPPMHQDEATGVFAPRAKGLIMPSAHDKAEAELIPPYASDGVVIPIREWGDYIQGRDKVTMRSLCGRRRKDQDGRGSCGPEGAANNAEAASELAGAPWPDLSPWGMYWSTSGGRDRGSSLQSNVSYLMEHGCPSMKVRPRSRGAFARPTEEEREDGLRYRLLEVRRVSNWEEYGSACILGFGCYSGYSGHAWYGCDALSSTRLVWENSWGDNWGDNGFGTLHKDRLYWGYGVYVFLTVTMPTPLATAA